MENKELKSKLNHLLRHGGFWLLVSDREQIVDLINCGAVKVFSKDNKWYWVSLGYTFGAKQRIKEFISVLTIKIKQDEDKEMLRMQDEN